MVSTYVPGFMQEKYNDLMVAYFQAIGQPAPEAQVRNLAAGHPEAYFKRAAEACQFRIGEWLVRASPSSLEYLIELKNEADGLVGVFNRNNGAINRKMIRAGNPTRVLAYQNQQ